MPASGQFTWELQPGARTTFRGFVDDVYAGQVDVRVRRTVGIGVQQRTTGVYTFSGVIARPEAGVQVTIARLDSQTNRVTGVASTRTTADGLLRTAADPAKDQTYMLAALDPSSLARLRFPLGELTKPDVRALAARATVGEVCDALRAAWGTYQPTADF